MAEIGRQETTKLCGLCDRLEGTDLELAKCLDCDLFMCKSCTKGHTRVKVTSHHRIQIDYPWGPPIPTPSSITCVKHTGETPSFYCYACNQLICCQCITSDHNQHSCSVIKHAVQEISEKFAKSLEIFKETKISKLEEKIKEVEKLKQDNNENGRINIQNISTRRDGVVSDVTETGQKLLQESKTLHHDNDKYLTNIHEHVEDEYSDMTAVFNKYQKVSQSDNDAEKITALILANTELEKFQPNHDEIREIHLPKFVPRKIAMAEMKLLLGSMQTNEERGSDFDSEVIVQFNNAKHSNSKKSDNTEREQQIQGRGDNPERPTLTEMLKILDDSEVNDQFKKVKHGNTEKSVNAEREQQSKGGSPERLTLTEMLKVLDDEGQSIPKSSPTINYDVKILQNFKTKEKTITSICPLTDSNTLIHYMDVYKNYIININGKVQSKFTLDFLIRDMVLTKNGIIATDVDNKIIHKLTKIGKQMQEISVALTLPYRLCMTRDGNILATMIDKWSFEVKDDSRRYVAKMTTSGEELRVYEYDNNGKRLFTLPASVGETSNEDICVVDKTQPDKGRLIVFDKTCKVKATYHGEPTRKKFIPRRVKCDDIGHIILTDKINNSVHLLDNNCQFIRYLLTDQQVTGDPWSLAIDPYGYLWLGCGNGQVYVVAYTRQQ